MKIHSFLSRKCRVKKSKYYGKGIFATKKIKKGEMIALWGGKIYSSQEVVRLSKKNSRFLTHTVSVFDNYYLGPLSVHSKEDATELFNHSCDPNAGVRGQILIVARKVIHPGEEICYDYDTTESSSTGSFRCGCKAFHCRKIINGSSWKNRKFIERNRSFLSLYLLEKHRLFLKKKSIRNLKDVKKSDRIER